MTTKLQQAFKRELDLNGEKYTLTVTPEGFRLVLKGKRKGIELAWASIIGGDAALATALNASTMGARSPGVSHPHTKHWVAAPPPRSGGPGAALDESPAFPRPTAALQLAVVVRVDVVRRELLARPDPAQRVELRPRRRAADEGVRLAGMVDPAERVVA